MTQSLRADFNDLMGRVLAGMGMSLPAAAPQDVYTFSFDDGVVIHCGLFRSGWCDLVSEAAKLPQPCSPAVLLSLLSLNRFEPEGHPVSVGVDAASGNVFVWTRQALDTLDAEGLQRLLRVQQARARDVRRCIDGKASPNAGSPAGALKHVSTGRDAGMRSLLQRNFNQT